MNATESKAGFGRQLGKALLYLLAFLGLQLLVAVVLMIVLIVPKLGSAGDPEQMTKLFTETLLSNYQLILVLTYCVEVLFFLGFFALRKKNLPEETSVRPLTAPGYGLALLLGLLSCVALTILLSFLPLPQGITEDYSDSIGTLLTGPVWLQLINVIVLGPLVEELVFRGLIHSRLRKAVSFWPAALISAALFGLALLNAIQSVYTFILGILLAFLFEKSGSLLGSLICHMAFNGTSFLFGFLPEMPVPVYLLMALAAAVLTAVILVRVSRGWVILGDRLPAPEPHPATVPVQIVSDKEDDDDDLI